MLIKLRSLTVFVCMLVLSACGGGSSTASNPVNPVVNIAPIVNAGIDATTRLPDTLALDGTVSDDGLPAGATVSAAWSVSSGPAGATFADVNAVDTIVTFVSEGTYVLQLTADDTALQTSDTVTVTVEAAPVLTDIVVTPSTAALASGATQQFVASGTDQYGAAVSVVATWSATGGTIDSGGIYTAGALAGAFVVTATDGSVSNSANVTITISASPPTADAGGPYVGVEGSAVALDGSGSTDANNDITDYDWDLDDDGAYDDATGANPTFTSVGSGVFTIGLRVTDADGAADVDSTTVTVSNLPPVADAGGPYSGDQGTDIVLDASASSDPSGIATYEWDLDNNATYETAGVNATFNSATPGTFTVGLRVTDNDGDSSTTTVDVTVNDIAPAAPTGLLASGDDASVSLDWVGNGEPDLAGYRVRRSLTPGGPYTVVSGPGLVVASNYVDSSVSNATTYHYVVTAVDGFPLESSFSTEVTVTPNGPVHAYWTFDEPPGSPALDTEQVLTGNDGSGTLNGASRVDDVSGVATPAASALEFDGIDDHVVIENTPQLNINDRAITMTAWIYPRDGGASGGSRMISRMNNAGNGDVFAMLIDQYRLRFRLDNVDMISSHIIQLDEWVHVAMVYDGFDKKIYVNGVLELATQVKTDPIDSSVNPVQLGRRETGDRYFKGLMDEVQIYNSALSAGQVATIHLGVAPVDPNPEEMNFADITVSAFALAVDMDGSHGVMFADIDNDTQPDFYLTNIFQDTGSRSESLLVNIDGSSFGEEASNRFVDDSDGGSHGAVWADLDNDGHYDLFNGSTWSWDGSVGGTFGFPVNNNVYSNDGSGSFTDETVFGSDIQITALETRGVTAFDMDGDGDLDLFGVASSNEAYLNNGSFVFVSHAGGVLSTTPAMQGVTDTDYDGDGDIDILAANRSGDFAILKNDGSGVFTQILPFTLNITDGAGDGITTGDVNNDGALDLLLASDGNAHLYLNDNLAPPPAEPSYTKAQSFSGTEGYMGGFADLDNDGDLDLVFAGDERVFMNQGDGTFDSGQSVPVSGINDPRAIAFADIDSDGDLDFAITAKQSRNWLVRNDIDAAFVGNWLSVKLVSPSGQAGAFGAKVSVFTAGGGTPLGMREAKGNYGYLAQDDPVLHFGLGTETLVDVVVDFVDDPGVGASVTCTGIAADQLILIDATQVDPCPP